ncbi:phosphatidate cytidylyltransferase [Thraustotheca clavata]|uniref:Phosphatidate cytidylyltransferase n=1 Tax=Thraustotheca clavata TaxID=74557 RepID=A0A1W0A1A7_9STRA|nr:phosphatidate cytidylyltransferase [Thraustotheca clavata]
MRVSAVLFGLLGASGAAALVNHQCVDVYRGAHYCFDSDSVVCGANEGSCPTAGTKAESRCLDFLESYNGDNCILPRDTVCQQIKGTWRCVLPAAPKPASHGYVSAPGTAAPAHGHVSAPGTPAATNVGVAQHRTAQPFPDPSDDGSDDSSDDNDDGDDDGDDDDNTTVNPATTTPTATTKSIEASVLGNPETRVIANSTEAPSTTETPASTTEAPVLQVNNQADSGSTSASQGTSQAMVAVYAAGGIACVAAAMFIVHRRHANQSKSDDECLVTPAIPHPDIVPKEGSTTPTLMLSNEKIKMAIEWARRIATFAVAAPVVFWLLTSAVGTAVLATLIQTGCLIEFRLNVCPAILQHVAGRKQISLPYVHAVVLALVGAGVCAGATVDKWTHDVMMNLGCFILILLHLVMAKAHREPTLHAGLLSLLLDIAAMSYIVNGFGHAILVRQASANFGMGLQIMTLSCSWICDTGALVAGSLFGKEKLLPAISPGKTMAGALGGIVFSITTVLGAASLPRTIAKLNLSLTVEIEAYTCLPPISVEHQVILGTVMGVACIAGDLVESYLKRVAQIKDSGTLFPGHGGCLDRMDSLLFVAPFMYYWTSYMEQF